MEKFGAYRKARDLFDLVVGDVALLSGEFSLGRLVSQPLASADSICANIEEGYGRLSRQEYIRFLDFSRGSDRETRGRYLRLRHWLKPEVIEARVQLLDEILGILTSTIATLRRSNPSSTNQHCFHEDSASHEARPLDTRPSPLPHESHPPVAVFVDPSLVKDRAAET